MNSGLLNNSGPSLPDMMRLNSRIDSNLDLRPIEPTENSILKGSLAYHYFAGGLSMHYGCTTELKNVYRSSEVPSGISFNVIFDGEVDFTLAGKRKRLSSNKETDQVQCMTLTLKRAEVLTRFLRKDMQVKKINVFVEERWLETRCTSAEDKELIKRLLEDHAAIHHWIPSKGLIKSLKRLTEAPLKNKEAKFFEKIKDEQRAIKLCSRLLKEFSHYIHAQIPPSPKKSRTYQHSKSKRPGQGFKKELDKTLNQSNKLPEIASLMNMSTSTLQRHCKLAFGVTVKEYTRMHKLEMAKQALINQSISVGEVSYLAGYQHPSNFITAFKKYFGISPGVLVKAHR